MTQKRTVVLTEFPLRAMDGSKIQAQLMQKQIWHNSLSNPRWINGDTYLQVNGYPLEQAGEGIWRDPETGECFTTA